MEKTQAIRTLANFQGSTVSERIAELETQNRRIQTGESFASTLEVPGEICTIVQIQEWESIRARRAALVAEFDAAEKAAPRHVEHFLDEEGIEAERLAIDSDWNHKGFRNACAFAEINAPWGVEIAERAELAEKSASLSGIVKAFEASEKTAPKVGRRKRVESLSAEVQRLLPRWLRVSRD